MLATGRAAASVLMALTAATAVAVRLAGGAPTAQLLFVGPLAAVAYATALGGGAGTAVDSAVAHTLLPAAITPLLFSAAVRSGAVAPSQRAAGFVVAVCLTVALGVAWELVEYGCDLLFGTRMSTSHADTERDLLADVVGAVIGAAVAVRVARDGRSE